MVDKRIAAAALEQEKIYLRIEFILV